MIDRCVILSALAMLCILYGVLALGPDRVEIQEEPIVEVILEVVEVDHEPLKPAIEKDRKTYYFERDTTEDHIDEVQTALFYATVPIGRYYITAYSHMETGSKITASIMPDMEDPWHDMEWLHTHTEEWCPITQINEWRPEINVDIQMTEEDLKEFQKKIKAYHLVTTKDYFQGRCPYTDKECKDWNCSECPVEERERKWVEGKEGEEA